MSRLRIGRGRLTVDLRHADQASDRKLQSVVAAPPGTVVVLTVAARQPVPLAIETVREAGGHLGLIDVDCPHTPTRLLWLDALEHGAWDWTAS